MAPLKHHTLNMKLFRISSSSGKVVAAGRHHSSGDDSFSSSTDCSTLTANAVPSKPIDAVATQPISPKSQRSVSFNPSVHVRRTICLSEYTPEEHANTWFSDVEYNVMRDERRETVLLMERGQPQINTCTNYYRGLEHRTREGARRRQFNQIDGTMAVLDEQDSHLSAGISDPEAIADVYKLCSAQCAAMAHKKALMDEREALGL